MTRFERELNGELGTFWQNDARKRIADMSDKAFNGDILLDDNGGAYWKKSGNYLPSDCVEVLKHTGFFFDADATAEGRDRATRAFLNEYRNTPHPLTDEMRFEMEAAFGKGATVVDVFSGEVYKI